MLIFIINNIVKKIKKYFRGFFTIKKLFLLSSLFLSFYRFLKFPYNVSTSEFHKFLNSDGCNISFMEIYGNDFILFKSNDQEYFTTSSIASNESFVNLLNKKQIHYNYIINQITAILNNPHYQFGACLALASYLIWDSISNYLSDFKISRRKIYSIGYSNEEFLNNFIAKPDIKDKLAFFIDQIRHQEKYKSKGLKPARGLLLYGPPGTGKTLIARCLASVYDVYFICRCASEFVELYVGSGPKAIRDTFAEAKEKKPAIIFIDELEAIGFQRSSSTYEYGHNLERYSALNQLLSEMDGLNDNDQIIVVGATNRYDLLDEALIRPGRFSMKIPVELPGEEERKKMFKHYLKVFNADEFDEESIDLFTKESIGFSGADIECVVNEAVSKSIADNNKTIEKDQILDLIRLNLKSKNDYHSNKFINNMNIR